MVETKHFTKQWMAQVMLILQRSRIERSRIERSRKGGKSAKTKH